MKEKLKSKLGGIAVPRGELTDIEFEALVRVLKRFADQSPEIDQFVDEMGDRVTDRLVRDVLKDPGEAQ